MRSGGRNSVRSLMILHSRDKTVAKMTKDGLVEQNLTNNTQRNISGRTADFSLSNRHNGQQTTSARTGRTRSRTQIYQQISREKNASNEGSNYNQGSTSNQISKRRKQKHKLQFSENETTDYRRNDTETPQSNSYQSSAFENIDTADTYKQVKDTADTGNTDISFSDSNSTFSFKDKEGKGDTSNFNIKDQKSDGSFNFRDAKETENYRRKETPNDTTKSNNKKRKSLQFKEDEATDVQDGNTAPKIEPPPTPTPTKDKPKTSIKKRDKNRYSRLKFAENEQTSNQESKSEAKFEPSNEPQTAQTEQVATTSAEQQTVSPPTPTALKFNKTSTATSVANAVVAKAAKEVADKAKKRKYRKLQFHESENVTERKLTQKNETSGTSETAENPLVAEYEKGLARTRFDSLSARQRHVIEGISKKQVKLKRKIDRVKKKIPKRKQLKVTHEFDEKSGVAKTRLKFENQPYTPKMPQESDFIPTVNQGVNSALSALDENDNDANKIIHKTTKLTQNSVNVALKFQHEIEKYRFDRINKSHEKADRLGKKTSNLNHKKDTKTDNYEKKNQRKQNQKRYNKKRYEHEARKSFRLTGRTENAFGESRKKTFSNLAELGKAFIKKSVPILGILLLFVLMFVLLGSLLGSCMAMMSQNASATSTTISSSYLAEDEDIEKSELYLRELEGKLQYRYNHIPAEYPGNNEYRYTADGDIEHDPYELMAYLTAVYEDFVFELLPIGVKDKIKDLFDQMYHLSVSESREIRYRVVGYDDDGDAIIEPYEWKICSATLNVKPLKDIIMPLMDEDQKEMYEVYVEIKGNRQYFESPLDFDWTGYITRYYGTRITYLGEEVLQRGVDIRTPNGTPILAAQDGTVTQVGESDDFGKYFVISKGDYTSKYGYCASVDVSVGDVVKTGQQVGTTSARFYIEILVEGNYLNPAYFVAFGDDEPTGSFEGATDFSGVPPEALSDPEFAALMAEATKYIGMPYVWGGSSPETGFDCSGFVGYVYGISRTTAQGIYNQTAPVNEDELKPGDLVFFQGTYSSVGDVSHIGIYVGDGKMLHCGDPIGYANLNSSYWQNHFYGYGRL
ncbi:peptidase M24 [Clostridia bacterium]|nr:peptidase M24 [Clostridia bacterium]